MHETSHRKWSQRFAGLPTRRAYLATSHPDGQDAVGKPVAKQSGALGWRFDRRKGLRVMLVTSRGRGQWILPKGWLVDGHTPCRAAAIEAFEEAGIFGDISSDACGAYTYGKVLDSGEVLPCRVTIYPLEVKGTLVSWAESHQRRRKWFGLDEAAAAVSQPDLARLLSQLARGQPGAEEATAL